MQRRTWDGGAHGFRRARWGSTTALGILVLGTWGLAACSGDDEHAPSAGLGYTCGGKVCGAAGGAGGPADGGEDGADGDVQDAAPDAYAGPTGSATGTVFAMEPPAFHPIKPAATEPLQWPATVSIYAHGTRWSTTYDKVEGFELLDVPAGDWDVLVEDIEGKNAILPSLIGASIKANKTVNWPIPVTTRPSMVVIFGSVTPERVIDPFRAQVLMSFVSCGLNGGLPQSGIKVLAPETSEGVIYDVPSGWELDGAGTGANGVAILVNLQTEEYPGVLIRFSYQIGQGEVRQTPEFRVQQGAVTRAYIALEC